MLSPRAGALFIWFFTVCQGNEKPSVSSRVLNAVKDLKPGGEAKTSWRHPERSEAERRSEPRNLCMNRSTSKQIFRLRSAFRSTPLKMTGMIVSFPLTFREESFFRDRFAHRYAGCMPRWPPYNSQACPPVCQSSSSGWKSSSPGNGSARCAAPDQSLSGRLLTRANRPRFFQVSRDFFRDAPEFSMLKSLPFLRDAGIFCGKTVQFIP